MKLTVLGKYGPWPAAGSACSGYLLEACGKRILLDCGCGVLGRLQLRCAITDLDAVVLSHLHSDHMGDMTVLRYALAYFQAKGLVRGRLPVYLPALPEAAAQAIAAESCYDCRFVRGGDAADFQGVALSFFATRHPVPCNAVKVSADGNVFVYSGDMNTTDGFTEFAAGCGMLLIDGCFPQSDWAPDKPHLSAALAAGVGKDAGAKRVLLTHFRPEDSEAALLAEARRVLPAAEAAADGAVYPV